MQEDIDPARRRVLIELLALGAFAAVAPGCGGGALGRVPRELPAGRSIYRVRGEVRVNDAAADEATTIPPDAAIDVGPDGEVVFVVGDAAFIARKGTRLRLAPAEDGNRLEGLNLEEGAVLSVFGGRPHRLQTPFSIVGVRGTGVYLETEEQLDYVCTCYGRTEIVARAAPSNREQIESERHDAPRYVLGPDAARATSGGRLQAAPFKNHTDEELTLIEALVGRAPPFGAVSGGYSGPRSRSY